MRTPTLASALRLAARLAITIACAAPLAPLELRLGTGVTAERWSALRTAGAQAGSEMIAGPITTLRFDRLALLFLAPTDDEMDALDRLHGAYLERFRAEIVPEIEALAGAMRGSMPSKAEFEKFLRDLDRIEAKVADADRAFLDAAAGLVAEERRGGIVRIRDARERQRLRSGLARMAPMVAGGGAVSFVDLADLVSREEYALAVDEAQREAFDAILRGLESRALIQARAYHAAAGDTFSAYFDIAAGMQAEMEAQRAAAAAAGAEDGGAAAMQSAMQTMMERMRAVAEPVVKAVRANHTANRSALAQLNGVLPEEIHLAVREDVATRTLGMMRYALAGILPDGDIRALLRRIARDPRLDAAIRAAAAEIGLRWRRASIGEIEKLVDAAADDRLPTNPMMAGMMGGGEGPLGEVGKRLEDLGQRTLRELQSLLGADESRYFVVAKTETPEGEVERIYPSAPEEEPDAEGESEGGGDFGGMRGKFTQTVPLPVPEQEVVRLARLAGVGEDALAVVESIARDAGERARKELDALRERHTERQRRAWSMTAEGGVEFDATAAAEASTVLREALPAVLAADRALRTDLAAALGLADDHPLILLLELERLPAAAADSWARESPVASPAQVLFSSKATPAEVAAFFAAGSEAWRALAAEIPALGAASIEILAEVTKSQHGFGAGQSQEENERATATMMRANARMQQAHDALATKVADAFERSIADGIADPEAARRLRGAYRRIAYPDIHRRGEDLSPVLAVACELRDLSDQQLARLEVLRSQYADRHDALCDEMVGLAGGERFGQEDEESWRAYAERQAKTEDIRFRLKEATEKARGAAIRILGRARAEDVRGLVLDSEARRAAREAEGGYDPFSADTEDD